MAAGRPKNDVVSQIRAWIWYGTVKAKSKDFISGVGNPPSNLPPSLQTKGMKLGREMTDYELDVVFDPMISNSAKGSGVGAARRKMFEAVRANGSIPSNGQSFNDKRPFDLVQEVEKVDCFRGTAAIIHSQLWKLLENPYMPLKDLRMLVVECVQRLGLDKLNNGRYVDDNSNELENYVKANPNLLYSDYLEMKKNLFDQGYNDALTDAFDNAERGFDLAALLGALSLEGKLAGDTNMAYHLESIYQSYIEVYCIHPHIRRLAQKFPNDPARTIYIDLGRRFKELAFDRIHDALTSTKIDGVDEYHAMFGPTSNQTSEIIAFLNRHERFFWKS